MLEQMLKYEGQYYKHDSLIKDVVKEHVSMSREYISSKNIYPYFLKEEIKILILFELRLIGLLELFNKEDTLENIKDINNYMLNNKTERGLKVLTNKVIKLIEKKVS